MPASDGLDFDDAGVAWSPDRLRAPSRTTHEASVELWVEPNHWNTSATILSIYSPEDRAVFRIGQSLTDLELSQEVNGPKKIKAAVTVSEVFGPSLRHGKPVFVTVSLNSRETAIYVDGRLVNRAPRLHIPGSELGGRLIIGGSPWQPDGFRGRVYGVALYDAGLSEAQVIDRYRAWTNNSPVGDSPEPSLVALYRFDERSGAVVHNGVPAGVNLRIPGSYAVIDKIALEPFWKEFDFSESYWSGNIKNIVGFLPLGFAFCAYFLMRRFRRPVLVTVVTGLLVSFTIEALQAFLPTRDSGTTDLVTNALGTFIGAQCYLRLYSDLSRFVPILDWLFVSPAILQAHENPKGSSGATVKVNAPRSDSNLAL